MKLEKVDKIEILKIDIEGAEFQVITQFLQKQTVCQVIDQIFNIFSKIRCTFSYDMRNVTS